MEKQKEIRKFITTDLKTRTEENSSERIISGYINKFNTRSQFMGFYEEVDNGAFDKTLADGHNIYAMYNHNSDKILGSSRSGSLKLNVDNVGLHFELRINPNISYASDIAELVKSGDLEGCSFGFWVTDDEWTYTEDKVDLSNPVAIYDKVPTNIFSKFAYYVLEWGKTSYIKRVIGLPGEHVQIMDGKVYINGQELDESAYLNSNVKTEAYGGMFTDIVVPEGYVFAMGDNRSVSADCRRFGCIPLEKIESKVWIRIWPLNLFGKVK